MVNGAQILEALASLESEKALAKKLLLKELKKDSKKLMKDFLIQKL
ncbi:hypothetical protein [Mesoplasma florum]|nr:hypothetical protein [Mesoplasma florum]